MLDADARSSRSTVTDERYARYALGVLFLVYVVNFIDRQLLSILAQDIKRALTISDSQVGFLYGTAFAVFYALFGIPLGRLADCWYRVRLIAIGLGVWSMMTAMSGLASSYQQLALARFVVGIGEASASPAAYSLLGDYFPRERRALALAIYSAGLFVGAGLALPLSGWVSHSWIQHFAGTEPPFGLAGWQVAFLGIGAPGLLLAFWTATLKEPERGSAEGRPAPPAAPRAWRAFAEDLASIIPPLTIWTVARSRGALLLNLMTLAGVATVSIGLVLLTRDVLQWSTLGVGLYAVASWAQKLRATDPPTYALIWGTSALRYALVAFSCLTVITYSLAFWIPPYAMRTFGVRGDLAGLFIGVPAALAMAIGVVFGGRISDLLRRRSSTGRIHLCVLSAVLPAPIAYAALEASDVHLLYALAPIAVLTANLYFASMAACIQDCLLPRMRSTGAATSFIATSLGLAVGPYLVARSARSAPASAPTRFRRETWAPTKRSVREPAGRGRVLANSGLPVLAIRCASSGRS